MSILPSVGFMVAVSQLHYMLTQGVRIEAGLSMKRAECPDGYHCYPADCTVENSNGEKGLDCECADGYVGEITWDGNVSNGKCELAPCNVENSNGEPGLACACLQAFSGSITWNGPNHDGNCTKAPCEVQNSNAEPGPACGCDEYSSGEISWNGDKFSGKCEDKDYDFGHFFTKGLLVLGTNKYKCCTHSRTKISKFMDLQNLDRYTPEKTFGAKDGCGYIFGDHFHNSGDPKSGGVCNAKLGDLTMLTGRNREKLKQDLREKAKTN